jgi:hypothetical protein
MPSLKVDEPRIAMPGRVLQAACSVVAAASFLWFLRDGIAPGWSRITTDFPNYYTAARLAVARQPLADFYDFPKFQREISRAGVHQQLGGYIPQTPLTMLPLIPLASLDPLNAKRVWMVLNLGFLGLSLWLLSRLTKFTVTQLWVVVFLGYLSLRQNFYLGQYYVFLLCIMTAGAYGMLRSIERTAGAAIAVACVLKLYGAPLACLLAAKRCWRAVFAVAAIVSLATALAVTLFGWHGMAFYATQVLPRSISGETLNPYHPVNNTFVTLLRRWLIAEPGLNPAPIADSPAVFAFLHTAFTLTVLLLPVLAAWRHPGPVTKSELAWWCIAVLLASPNTASYTFVLLILPVALLLDELSLKDWPYVIVPYALLALPLRPAWSSLFPKAWLLLFLFVWSGSRTSSSIEPRSYAYGAIAILTIAAGSAVFAVKHPERPAESATQIAIERDAVYSSAPVLTKAGLFFESIAREQYAIGHWNGNSETLVMDGHMFHPSAPDSGDRVYFELLVNGHSSIAFIDLRGRSHGFVAIDRPEPCEPAVAHDGGKLAFVSLGELYVLDGRYSRKLKTPAFAHDPSFAPGDRELVYVAGGPDHSQIVRIDLDRGESTVLLDREEELASPSVSPDHRRLAFAARHFSNWQIWTEDLILHREVQSTNGPCNSWAPTWGLGASEISFASDCKRGLNLPALFRMSLGERTIIDAGVH